MAPSPTVVKGYVKTESMILIVLIALALGFVGGVVFGVYRSAGNMPMSADSAASAPLSPEQAQAIAAWVQETQNDPNNVNAWTQLGHLYFDTGQPAKAIEAYEKSLTLDANRPDVWTDLGVMYRRQGDPQKAVQTFDRALALNANHEIAMFNKGVVLLHDLQNTKAALETWEKLVQINPQARTPNGQPVKELVEEFKKNLSSQPPEK